MHDVLILARHFKEIWSLFVANESSVSSVLNAADGNRVWLVGMVFMFNGTWQIVDIVDMDVVRTIGISYLSFSN